MRQVYRREQRYYDKIKILPQLRSVDAGGIEMTRKRFIKLLMSRGVQRNDAEAIALLVRIKLKSIEKEKGEQNERN